MGVKLSRKKPKQFLVSSIYRLQKLLPLSSAVKLKLFLNLEWIFDRLSHEMSFKVFNTESHPLRIHSKKFILEGISNEDTVLDLGCNFGVLSYAAAFKAKEVVGVDVIPTVIEEAKKRYPKENLEFIVGEAREYLNTTKKTFNVLLLSHVLEHIDDPKNFIMSFKHYFKKIFVEVPDFDKNYLNHYRQSTDNKLIYTDDDHVSEFDRDELTALLKDCGLEILTADYRFGVIKLWCKTV
ncbi:MAG TPA: class I SAM-dependent methyltransferase [Bacteroidia bacterium]|jgi:SAM-dependent methyltransferase|nr:class I SAM-dependent methyltransferase [Bacteroidia bacterium]